MIYYLIATSFFVSVDSFVCGFSLSLSKKKKLPVVSGIALTVLIMCLVTNYSTAFFADKITQKTASLGGLILIGIGVYNLLKKKSAENTEWKGTFSQSIITGFAVGLDGALANLSLSLMGMNEFYVPLTIALIHALMIYLGILLSQTKIAKKFAKIEFLSPVILILLGGYKLLGLFI